jgi:retinol dehydrogenase-12
MSKPEIQSGETFSIEPKIGAGVRIFLYSQLFVTPEYPEKSFEGQTVIVTGSNVGLGLEAARHFYRLGCARLILAVRTPSKGEAAKEDIVRSVTSRSDAAAIEIWELNQSSAASTLAFADRVRAECPRVDALVENAGVGPRAFQLTDDGFEESAQINVLNTFLLLLSLLPRLVETKKKFTSSVPDVTVVTSEAHRLTKFAEINELDMFASMNREENFQGPER